MKRLILILIAALSLTACNESGSESGEFNLTGGVFMLPFNQCTYLSGPDVWAVYSQAGDYVNTYLAEADCTSDVTFWAPTITMTHPNDPPANLPNGSYVDYDPIMNTATAAALVWSSY